MQIQDMQTITNGLANGDNTQALGSAIGTGIGAAFGAPTLGAAIGSIAGTAVGALIPQYNQVRGSSVGLNLARGGLKPYYIRLEEPTPSVMTAISEYYLYFGCPTNRTVKNLASFDDYMWQGHAYIQGEMTLHLANIPHHIYNQINEIFRRGVHIHKQPAG